MSTYSKQKGRDAEREIAEILTEAGFPCIRNERNSGGGEDVSHQIPGVWLEVKRQERLSLPAAMRQARKAAGDKKPVVVHRPNRAPWMVTLDLDHLLDLLRRALDREA